MKDQSYASDRPDAWLASVMSGTSAATMTTIRCETGELMRAADGCLLHRDCVRRPNHGGDHVFGPWTAVRP